MSRQPQDESVNLKIKQDLARALTLDLGVSSLFQICQSKLSDEVLGKISVSTNANNKDKFICKRFTQPVALAHGILLIAIALTWFALSPTVRAVSPPPDGGYPNDTTAEGDTAASLA